MRPFHVSALAAAALTLLWSCVDAPLAPGAGGRLELPVGVALGPAAADAAPINRIRASAQLVPSGASVGQVALAVDPGADAWTLEIPLDGVAPPVSVQVTVELINDAGGQETVEYSGKVGPITVGVDVQSAPAAVVLVRGGLGNLSVTRVQIAEPVPTVMEGATASLQASVTAADPSARPTVFWSSLDPNVVMTGSTATGVRPGVARVVASAGNVADTAQVTVLPRPVLTIVGGGNGLGTVSGSGISCAIANAAASGDCTETFDTNTQVTLSATPASGSTFGGWSGGGCAGTAGCVVTMDAARTVTASFVQVTPECTITVNAGAGGTASLSSGAATGACGRSVTVGATPASGFTFARWEVNGSQVSTANPYTFTLGANTAVSAVFTPIPATCAITVAAGAGGTAALTGGGASGTCGRAVTVAATPNSGFAFTRWEVNGSQVSTANPYTLALDANLTVAAVFTPIPASCAITVTAGTGGSAALTSGSATGACGRSATVTATPSSGFTFTRWDVNGSPGSTSNPYTFSPNMNVTLTAVFTAIPATCAITVGAGAGGTAALTNGGATGVCGRSVTLTATPGNGFSFTRWEVNGSPVSTANPYTFALTATVSVTAVFTQITADCSITVTAGNGGTAALSGGGATGPCGRSVTVTATPLNANFAFTRWEQNGSQVSGSNPYTFTLGSNLTINALFTYTGPLVVTGAADQITTSSGRISGTVEERTGQVFSTWFEWGTSSTLATFSSTPPTPAAVCPAGVCTYYSTLSGLVGGTPYYYRLVASGAAGISRGSIRSFAPTATCTLSAEPSSEGVGTTIFLGGTAAVTSGGATGACGRSVTVTATPARDYKFTGWSVNGVQVSTSNPYTFTLNTDQRIVASFAFVGQPPVISGMTVTLVGVNHPSCAVSAGANGGSAYNYQFSYTDPDGDVVATGSPIAIVFTWQPSGSTGSASYAPASVTGDGSSGTMLLGLCHLYQSSTSISALVTLRDAKGNASNGLSAITNKPAGANAPGVEGGEAITPPVPPRP